MNFSNNAPVCQSTEDNGVGASLDATIGPEGSRERTTAHLRLLWENRGLLLRTFLIALAASAIIVFLIPARYDATTQLMPPDSQSGSNMALLSAVAGRAGGLGAVAGDLLGVKNSGALFVGVLQSRTVQDRLIEQFGLKRVYGESKIEDARQALLDHTNISEDRKSGIIAITVRDHDPRRAAALAQAYVTELDRLVAQVSTSSARRERIFLEGRLNTVKQDLDNAAQKFSEFASKNTAIDIPAQGKAMVEAAATLQGQLIAAESELRGLEAIYTDQNIRVRALRARVAELRTQLGKIGGDSGASGALSSKSDPSLYPSIRQLPRLGVTYADLYRQTKIEETVFELLTQQYELAKVQEAKEIPSVKILDAAVVPTKKSFPHRMSLITAGTALAIGALCAWLFAKRYWQAIDPQDPGKQFAEEVVSELRLEAARFAPAGAAISRALARRRRGSDSGPRQVELQAEENPSTAAEISRAARSGHE
ncbi:MAG TPA: Wzz/FepE/Etk N-terminal domain-containing protein [Candidatus Binatus sp.]|nr:Wzz/FepE/Etk N-terminal domain-containing protein [Candidatus Binatus sp.]